jgi:hypothetical protein
MYFWNLVQNVHVLIFEYLLTQWLCGLFFIFLKHRIAPVGVAAAVKEF